MDFINQKWVFFSFLEIDFSSSSSVSGFWHYWHQTNLEKFSEIQQALMNEDTVVRNSLPDEEAFIMPNNFYLRFLYDEKTSGSWGDEILWEKRDKYKKVQEELQRYLFFIERVARIIKKGEIPIGDLEGGIAGIHTTPLNQKLMDVDGVVHFVPPFLTIPNEGDVGFFRVRKFFKTLEAFLFSELVEYLITFQSPMRCAECSKLIFDPSTNQLSRFRKFGDPVYHRYNRDERDKDSCWSKSRRKKWKDSKQKSRKSQKKSQKEVNENHE